MTTTNPIAARANRAVATSAADAAHRITHAENRRLIAADFDRLMGHPMQQLDALIDMVNPNRTKPEPWPEPERIVTDDLTAEQSDAICDIGIDFERWNNAGVTDDADELAALITAIHRAAELLPLTAADAKRTELEEQA